MKPRAFEYCRPASLAEALTILAGSDEDSQVMAGGQSLVPMMNLRVATPVKLIDIARLPELRARSEGANSVTLGACVTHADIEDGRVPDPTGGLIRRVAANIAYRAIRNRGTIGGSLALADPAAEWPSVLAALGAQVVLDGPSGRRKVSADQFISGIFQTQIERGELIFEIEIPKLSSASRTGYEKFARKTGAFAESIAIAVHDRPREVHRIVLGASGGAPLLLSKTSALLASSDIDEERLQSAVSSDLAASGRPFDAVQRALHSVTIQRAVAQVVR